MGEAVNRKGAFFSSIQINYFTEVHRLLNFQPECQSGIRNLYGSPYRHSPKVCMTSPRPSNAMSYFYTPSPNVHMTSPRPSPCRRGGPFTCKEKGNISPDSGSCTLLDPLEHAVQVITDFVIRKPQYHDSKILHDSFSLFIMLFPVGSRMYRTINFYYQSCFMTIEISNIMVDRMLTSEFKISKFIRSQMLPKNLFIRSQLFS